MNSAGNGVASLLRPIAVEIGRIKVCYLLSYTKFKSASSLITFNTGTAVTSILGWRSSLTITGFAGYSESAKSHNSCTLF